MWSVGLNNSLFRLLKAVFKFARPMYTADAIMYLYVECVYIMKNFQSHYFEEWELENSM